MSVDPLAEDFVGWTPYHYVHQNPINLIDPTGMSADPPDGEFGQGHRHTDSDGTKWQLNGSVWENQSGGGDQWQNETLDEITIDIDRKPSKLSADLTNAYSASGFRHGVEWMKHNVSFGIYDFLYNNPAVTGYGSGEYGAYIPTSRDVSKGLMTFGDGMMYLGYAGIFSGVGAKPGAGLVAIGSGISSAGLLFDATLDYQDGNTNLALFKISALGLTPLLGNQAKRGARWFNGLNSSSTRVGNTSTDYFIDAQMNYYQGKVIENQENKNR